MLYHDSHDETYRSPLGALPCGAAATIRFQCDESDTVFLRTWDGAEKMIPMRRNEDGLFEATLTVPETPMLFWYDFVIPRAWDTARYGNNDEEMGGVGRYWAGQPKSYQITVYDAAYETPAFLREGVIYQIFPDRFAKGKNGQKGRVRRIAKTHPEASFHESWDEAPTLDIDPENGDNRALDFFGGTLEGIVEHLDEIEALGASVIYLNPIFRARTNHRYDTGSYEEIDPIAGDEKSFGRLLREAKKRGIRVLMDGVFSHTGADSLYFNRWGRYESVGAYQGELSIYSDWYHFDEFPDKYRSWWGFYTLPVVNKDCPSYRRYLLNAEDGVLPLRVREGAAGWRLDVADELPVDLLREMRQAVKQADPSAVLIGEVWEDASNKISYGRQRSYCLGDTLDGVMNYPLRRAVIDFFMGVCSAEHLRRVILHQLEVYPAPFLCSQMNLLGSHDRVRALNAFSGYDRPGAIQMDRAEAEHIRLTDEELALAKKRYLAALRLICALPGVPTVYYGDEIGMQGMADPWNRAPMAWSHADSVHREQTAALLCARRDDPLLQRGFLSAEAPDEDTIVIRRFAKDGKDLFGQPLEGAEEIRVSRKME